MSREHANHKPGSSEINQEVLYAHLQDALTCFKRMVQINLQLIDLPTANPCVVREVDSNLVM